MKSSDFTEYELNLTGTMVNIGSTMSGNGLLEWTRSKRGGNTAEAERRSIILLASAVRCGIIAFNSSTQGFDLTQYGHTVGKAKLAGKLLYTEAKRPLNLKNVGNTAWSQDETELLQEWRKRWGPKGDINLAIMIERTLGAIRTKVHDLKIEEEAALSKDKTTEEICNSVDLPTYDLATLPEVPEDILHGTTLPGELMKVGEQHDKPMDSPEGEPIILHLTQIPDQIVYLGRTYKLID